MSVIWGKSSLSSSNGNCVEVARPGGSRRKSGVLFSAVCSLAGSKASVARHLQLGLGLLMTSPPFVMIRVPHIEAAPSDAILRAAEPEATCPLSVLCIGQKEHGDTFCAYRVPFEHNVSPRLQSRSLKII